MSDIAEEKTKRGDRERREQSQGQVKRGNKKSRLREEKTKGWRGEECAETEQNCPKNK